MKRDLTKLVVIFALSSTELFAGPLGLKELINHALVNSPSFKNTVNNLSMNELKLSNAFSAFFPSLDLQTVQGYKDGEPTKASDKYPGELQLSLTSKIYDNGTNLINYDLAKKQKQVGQIKLERDRSELCLELTKEYYNYTLAFKVYKVQEFQYSLLKQQFNSIENQYHQGRKTRIDYIRFKARLQRANLSMQKAQVTQNKSLEEIKKILNWEDAPLEIYVEENDLIKDKIPTSAVVFENHFDYRIAQLNKSINQFDVTLEKRKYWPQLFLETNATYTNSDYLKGANSFSDDRQTNWSALLTFKFNLWDWGTRKRNIAIAKIQRNTKNNSIDSSLLTLRATINKLLLDIKQQKKNYLLNKELVELEKNNYKTLEINYRNGRTTFLDLINSLNDYTNSQESFYRDLFLLKSLMAEYQYHEGTLYEHVQNN